jgi:hypothetical protein
MIYPDFPWFSLIFPDLPWFTLIYPYLPLFTLIFPDLLCSTLIYPDLIWFTLIYPDLPCFTLIYPDLPWFTKAYPDLLCFTLIFPALPWAKLDKWCLWIFLELWTFLSVLFVHFCSYRQTVRGKGHLHSCNAGRKDNLRCSILRKDNPKIVIKILVYRENV